MTILWMIWTWVWLFGASFWMDPFGQQFILDKTMRRIYDTWRVIFGTVWEFETRKLISEQKGITGVSNHRFQRCYVDVAKLIVWKGSSVHQRQSLRLLRLSALCGENGRWSHCDLEEQNLMVFGKQSLQRYESNRRNADGVRVENIARNHNVGPL